MLIANSAVMISGRGIKGDHYDSRQNEPRQVTIIANEDIAAIASFSARKVSGLNYYGGIWSPRGSI